MGSVRRPTHSSNATSPVNPSLIPPPDIECDDGPGTVLNALLLLNNLITLTNLLDRYNEETEARGLATCLRSLHKEAAVLALGLCSLRSSIVWHK